jgi:predicted nucleic acid-binding protein
MSNGASVATTDEPSNPAVVCDAGPLIHLDECGCLDLLNDFPRVLVPQAVWQEVGRHRPGALSQSGVTLHCVAPQSPEPSNLATLSQVFGLHLGERQALHLASINLPCLLLSDDTAARLAADNLSIPTHGTIGILVRAIRRKQRAKAEILATLAGLPGCSTLHLKRSLLDAVIREVQENG